MKGRSRTDSSRWQGRIALMRLAREHADVGVEERAEAVVLVEAIDQAEEQIDRRRDRSRRSSMRFQNSCPARALEPHHQQHERSAGQQVQTRRQVASAGSSQMRREPISSARRCCRCAATRTETRTQPASAARCSCSPSCSACSAGAWCRTAALALRRRIASWLNLNCRRKRKQTSAVSTVTRMLVL